MLQAKTISLIVCIGICWGSAPEFACIKNGTSFSPAAPAVVDTLYSPITVVPTADSLTYLALGDSYTIGQSVAISDRYPVQAVDRLRGDGIGCKDPQIIAVTGWTTANLLQAVPATIPVPPYSIVTLLIGVNNQYQGRSQSEYRDQFTTLVKQSILLAGDRPSHVIVLSIPDYSVTPYARGQDTSYIAAQIDSFNLINIAVARDHGVQYLDITDESRKAAGDASLIAGDGLHFSGKEYAIWASMLEPMMKGLNK